MTAFRLPVGRESEDLSLSNYAGNVDPATLLGVLDEWASGEEAVEAAREDYQRAMRRERQGGKADVVLVVGGVERRVNALGLNLGQVLEAEGIDPAKVRIRGVAGARLNFVPRDKQRFTLISKQAGQTV